MATIEADTCSYADVNTALAAASNGDQILVPSGTATWTSLLTVGKYVSMIFDESEITNGRDDDDPIILLEPSDYSSNLPLRLSGGVFDAAGHRILDLGVSAKAAPFVRQTNVRVDHCTFTRSEGSHQKGQGIYNHGPLYGVVDNCIFTGMGYPVAHSFGVVSDDWWENSPQSIFALGGQWYMYWEDNSFTIASGGSDILTDGEYSARYTFRYNDINTEAIDTYSLFDIHGCQDYPNTFMASCFGAELYGNQITHGAQDLGFFAQRSGQCLVFLNNATGSTTPWTKGYTSGACIAPTTYCADQITHNSYQWRNRRNATGAMWEMDAQGGLDACELEDIPTAGRDMFDESSTPGITIGTMANLPATCTVGQGYWATDQDTSDLTDFVGASPTTLISGTLYICQTTNIWTEFYTPYTYPHPLRGEGEPEVIDGTIWGDLIGAQSPAETSKPSRHFSMAFM